MKCWMGSLGVSNYRGIVSPSYTVLEPTKDIDNQYFHYLLRSEKYRQIYESLSYGVRVGQWELRYHDFKLIPALYPELKEQKRISKYLDKKTEKIELLIEKIEKKIELLKEQKTALINQYVTKGLDPNVEMKDSGVNWIGKIPKHWEKTINKSFLTLKKNIVGSKSNEYNVLGLTKKGVIIKDIESGKGKLPETFDIYQLVEKNNFILCLFDIDETPRTVGLSNYNGITSPDYRVFECNNLVSNEFIYFILIAIDNLKAFRPYYSGLRKRLKPSTFLSLHSFLPTLEEQKEIVNFIVNQQNHLDKLIQLHMKKSEILNEFRQSLISSVVTGKIRVTEDMI